MGLLESRGRSDRSPRRRRLARLTAAAWILAAAALAGSEEPRGRLTERIVCAGRPDQSYALFLPARYSPEKRWPILYALDARGRATLPIERFRAAAEEFGWIIASSYNSRSDTRDDPNTPALSAMWNDVHARAAIDDRRTYLTGFSGGARAAVLLARRAPGAVAGVIGCGAGFPEEKAQTLSIPYFGTVGDRDFNYYEMRALEETLSAAGSVHRVEVFEGGHDWPPDALAREAVAWMELQAIKSGTRPRDAEAIAAFYAEDLRRAQSLETGGHAPDALIRYRRIARDFAGLTDVSSAESRAEGLGESPEVRRAVAQARRRDERDRATLRTLFAKLDRALASPEPPLAGAIAAELGISALRKRAASDDSPEERASARRILANLRAQTSFYMPEKLLAEGDSSRARVVLSVAAALDPADPLGDYNLAAADARTGRTARAIEELRWAVEKGFRRFELIDGDPDFASARADPAFQKWLAEARARDPTPTPPSR